MIKQFVASERVKYQDSSNLFLCPQYAWQMVSLDFIEGLPQSQHFNCILVVVDKFSNYAHFVPLKHPFNAFQVTMAYMYHIFKLHGLPEALISNRYRIFTSSL